MVLGLNIRLRSNLSGQEGVVRLVQGKENWRVTSTRSSQSHGEVLFLAGLSAVGFATQQTRTHEHMYTRVRTEDV